MQDNPLPPTPPTEIEEPGSENTEETLSPVARPRFTLVATLLFVLVAFALGMGAGYFIWARPLEARAVAAEAKLAEADKTAVAGQNAESEANAQVQVPEQVKRYDVPVEGNPVLGSNDAKITIIEFSDYQCPFCQKWQQEVMPQIRSKYGDKVRIVYRDFPLYEIHPEAGPAAQAAKCAGAQNKYWEFHDLLFSGQKQLSSQTYEDYATSLSLNMTDFKKCLADKPYEKDVKANYDYASQLGVRSTPTFFINGLAVVGAQPFSVFEQIIDMELAGKIPQK